MKPLDPKLLRYARAARFYVILTAVLGTLTALFVIAEALLIANSLAPVVDGDKDLADVTTLLWALLGVVVARALIVAIQERYAHRSAHRVIAELRREVLERSVGMGPRWLAEGNGPRVVTLVTQGLNDLEPYFVKYLPQLLLTSTVTPLTLIVVFGLDWISALIITVTIPLVPIFMILIGRLTQTFADKRLRTMSRLGAQVLDLLAGLPTLKALGREKGPAARVRALGKAHREATMVTLRVAFLSGMVLELVTTLSVALVAVSIGIRLVHGDLDLTTGVAVLVLAPEVFFPIRQIGTQFHASSNGVAAAQRAFEIIETDRPQPGTHAAPDLHESRITLDHLSVRAPGRSMIAPSDVNATITPGSIVALVGPNGAGKSTTVSVLLGLIPPDDGTVTVRGPEGTELTLADIDPATWWPQIAWVPQRPALVPGTVTDNLALGLGPEHADQEHFEQAAAVTGFAEVVAKLPDGYDTLLGQGGVGLSVGQRQRLVLTRALAGSHPLVILDEPTAHLDALGEQTILDAAERMRAEGRTVIVIAHRASLVGLADTVINVHAKLIPTDEEPGNAAPSEPTSSTPEVTA